MKINQELKEELRTYLRKRLSEGQLKVTITAPYRLSEAEVKQVSQKLSIPNSVEIVVKVSDTLLGGFTVEFGSQLIDLSIANTLHTLQQRLYELN